MTAPRKRFSPKGSAGRRGTPPPQLPDTLEGVWVQVAFGKVEEARKTIDAVPSQYPFDLGYREVERVDRESCGCMLDDDTRRRSLSRGWAVAPAAGGSA